MTALLQKTLNRLAHLPEEQQNLVAERITAILNEIEGTPEQKLSRPEREDIIKRVVADNEELNSRLA